MKPGDRVIWIRQLRGGYGYAERVPAEVVHVGENRVTIRAMLLSERMVTRVVRAYNLVPDNGAP